MCSELGYFACSLISGLNDGAVTLKEAYQDLCMGIQDPLHRKIAKLEHIHISIISNRALIYDKDIPFNTFVQKGTPKWCFSYKVET